METQIEEYKKTLTQMFKNVAEQNQKDLLSEEDKAKGLIGKIMNIGGIKMQGNYPVYFWLMDNNYFDSGLPPPALFRKNHPSINVNKKFLPTNLEIKLILGRGTIHTERSITWKEGERTKDNFYSLLPTNDPSEKDKKKIIIAPADVRLCGQTQGREGYLRERRPSKIKGYTSLQIVRTLNEFSRIDSDPNFEDYCKDKCEWAISTTEYEIDRITIPKEKISPLRYWKSAEPENLEDLFAQLNALNDLITENYRKDLQNKWPFKK